MNPPRPKLQSDDPQAGFFSAELALCFTFVDIAETNFKSGNAEAARRALKKAQVGLATIERYLKDPTHSRHLTDKEQQETKDESERLRIRVKSVTAKKGPAKA